MRPGVPKTASQSGLEEEEKEKEEEEEEKEKEKEEEEEGCWESCSPNPAPRSAPRLWQPPSSGVKRAVPSAPLLPSRTRRRF